MDDSRKRLSEVFEHDRVLHEALAALLASKPRAVLAALSEVVDRDCHVEDEDAERRLVRVATILADIEGAAAGAAALALRLLDSSSPVVRAAAGEALLDVAVDGAAAVLEAAGSLVERTDLSRALVELPYLLTEVEHGRVGDVLSRLLGHPDADVVAAALDAVVLRDDPSALPAVRALENDGRLATVTDEDESDSGPVPVSLLAAEAVEALSRKVGRKGRRR